MQQPQQLCPIKPNCVFFQNLMANQRMIAALQNRVSELESDAKKTNGVDQEDPKEVPNEKK